MESITLTLSRWATIELYVPAYGQYERPGDEVNLHEVSVQGARSNDELWLRFGIDAQDVIVNGGDGDLVHTHDWMTALVGAHLRCKSEMPFVFSVHLPQTAPVNRAMENLGIAYADIVLVNSESVKSELLARSVRPQVISVIPNGVDLAKFHPPSGVEGQDELILFVGRLVPQKGADTLLAAFSLVLRRCRSSRLMIVGDGHQELYLRRLARHLGVSHRVKFLGWKSGSALVDLYQQASVVAAPSRYEPFGMVALEAMACARPVVATQVGGLAELIEDRASGFLVPVNDHLRLAQRLTALLEDKNLRLRIGEMARMRASEFDWQRIGSMTMQVYQDVLKGRRPPRSKGAYQILTQQLIESVRSDLRPCAQRVVESLLRSMPDMVE